MKIKLGKGSVKCELLANMCPPHEPDVVGKCKHSASSSLQGEAEVRKGLVECKLLALASHQFWGTWAILQASQADYWILLRIYDAMSIRLLKPSLCLLAFHSATYYRVLTKSTHGDSTDFDRFSNPEIYGGIGKAASLFMFFWEH